MHRLLLVLVAVALVAAVPAPARAATCPGKSVVFASPTVVVVKAKAKRQRGGGRSANIVACVRSTGRKRVVSAEYLVPGADGNAAILGLFGRNLLVEDSGSGAESESTTRIMVDLATGKRTEQSYVGGTDFTGTTAASAAGLLGLETGSGTTLTLRRPGAKDRVLATGDGLSAIALGADTAYWTATPAGGLPAARSATVPAGLPGFSARPWPGPSDATLRRVVPESSSGPVADLTAIGPTLLAYRFTVGDRTAVVVYDRRTKAPAHLALLPTAAVGEVAYGAGGIVVTGPAGATLVVKRTVASLGTEPATDPAISDPISEQDGTVTPPVAYWTTAGGPQRS